MYGECDERFFPTIMRLADRWNGKIPRIAEGGKKQTTYVGKLQQLFVDHFVNFVFFDFSIVFRPVEGFSGFLGFSRMNQPHETICSQ